MESAALLFLLALKTACASSMGVMFGWQPMPGSDSMNGGQKVEYIVQIEPELAATLKDGQSIPITSDVPNDIGPIGRIRIVVGRDELPRQKLVTEFKPWPKEKMPAGLVETQFTVPPVQSSGSGRYGAQPASNNQILPPGGNGASGANPFARSLQNSAQQARNASNDTKQILPPANELFGQGNNAGQSVKTAINNAGNQLRQDFQRGVEQMADRTGQQLRQAVDNVGSGARDAVDKFGRSLGQQRSVLSSNSGQGQDSILPPASQRTSSPTNQPPSIAKGPRIDQPIQQQQPPRRAPQLSFAGSTEGSANPTSQPGVFDAPWPPISSPPIATTTNSTLPATNVSNPPNDRYGNQSSQPSGQSAQWPKQPVDNNGLNQNNSSSPRYASGNQSSYDPFSNSSNEGPKFPMGSPQSSPSQQANRNWPSQPPKAEIRRDMLEAPPSGGTHMASNPPPSYQEQIAARPPFTTQPTNNQTVNTQQVSTQPQDLGWGQNGSNAQNNDTNSQGGTTLFPLLLSWVLLSGSGAGNLYLFWSYLDVRSKYHGMVHGAPHRRDRYDD